MFFFVWMIIQQSTVKSAFFYMRVLCFSRTLEFIFFFTSRLRLQRHFPLLYWHFKLALETLHQIRLRPDPAVKGNGEM